MKLLHLNVHMWRGSDGGRNVGAVADLIRREAPDIVSLVEVDEPWGRPVNFDGSPMSWVTAGRSCRWEVAVPALQLHEAVAEKGAIVVGQRHGGVDAFRETHERRELPKSNVGRHRQFVQSVERPGDLGRGAVASHRATCTSRSAVMS